MATGRYLNDALVPALGVGSIDGTNDRFLVHDASATSVAQVTASDVLKRLLSSSDVSWMSSLANLAAVDSANDKFAVWDASASAWKLLTATEILDRLLTTLDPSALANLSGGINDIDHDNDFFLVWDASAGVFKTYWAGQTTRRLWSGPKNDITSTPYTVTTADAGEVFTNTGSVIAVTMNLPAATAGLRFSFARVADYAITLDGNGSETINGATTYTLSRAGRVDVECFVNGAWVVTQDSTTDDGYSTQENFTGNDTLTSGETGKTCTNIGASATVTLTLPAAASGLWFRFVRSAAYELRVDPNGSETIGEGGAGKYLTIQGSGAVTVRSFASGSWLVVDDSAIFNYEA